jgi:hypothetical protein
VPDARRPRQHNDRSRSARPGLHRPLAFGLCNRAARSGGGSWTSLAGRRWCVAGRTARSTLCLDGSFREPVPRRARIDVEGPGGMGTATSWQQPVPPRRGDRGARARPTWIGPRDQAAVWRADHRFRWRSCRHHPARGSRRAARAIDQRGRRPASSRGRPPCRSASRSSPTAATTEFGGTTMRTLPDCRSVGPRPPSGRPATSVPSRSRPRRPASTTS